MKKGACESYLPEGSLKDIYKTDRIYERHLNEYEINPLYYDTFKENGMNITALSEEGSYIDGFSIEGHIWYNAVKFNPQFKSVIGSTHVIFDSFVDQILCITN